MSTGGLLALKWNNHCSSFLHILSSLHKKHNYDDATVACDGKLYPVHKLVLSTCSEYFEEMFENTHGKHPVIVLNKDINRHIFEALLQYMYIGEVNVVQEKLTELISAAECLRIKGLAVPDEPPPETSFRSNKSGGSGKRKQDHIVQSSSNNEEGYNPPSKIHKSHSGGGNSNRSTFHSSNENSRNEHATPISNNSNNKPPSSRNNNFNVENSSRGNSTFQSRRTTKHTMEERQANQLKEDDYIEEIPSNPVKEELVDPEHTGNEKNAEHKISNAGSGGDEDGVCDESGVGLLSGGGGDAEEDSKYGILAETVGGGGGNEEGNTWNEAINNKEGESDDVYGDYTGEGSTPAAIDDGEDTSQQPDDITHGVSSTAVTARLHSGTRRRLTFDSYIAAVVSSACDSRGGPSTGRHPQSSTGRVVTDTNRSSKASSNLSGSFATMLSKASSNLLVPNTIGEVTKAQSNLPPPFTNLSVSKTSSNLPVPFTIASVPKDAPSNLPVPFTTVSAESSANLPVSGNIKLTTDSRSSRRLNRISFVNSARTNVGKLNTSEVSIPAQSGLTVQKQPTTNCNRRLQQISPASTSQQPRNNGPGATNGASTSVKMVEEQQKQFDLSIREEEDNIDHLCTPCGIWRCDHCDYHCMFKVVFLVHYRRHTRPFKRSSCSYR